MNTRKPFEEGLVRAMKWLHGNYPFVDLVFTLDGDGIQTSNNITYRNLNEKKHPSGLGVDRRYRPYYRLALENDGVIVTEPYLSTSSHNLCLSSAVRCLADDGSVKGILVLDIDLADAIEFLMGDRKRKKFQPFFVSIYSLIAIGLFIVVGILLFSAAGEIATLMDRSGQNHPGRRSAYAQGHLPPQLYPAHHHPLYRGYPHCRVHRIPAADVQIRARLAGIPQQRRRHDGHRHRPAGRPGHLRIPRRESGAGAKSPAAGQNRAAKITGHNQAKTHVAPHNQHLKCRPDTKYRPINQYPAA